jgi:FdhE protein
MNKAGAPRYDPIPIGEIAAPPFVRIKCVLCESTKGIAYQELEGARDTVKAETCEHCHGYVKILHQQKNPQLDPVADDVAMLGLDILLRERGYRRGAVNPFLLGY